MNHPFLEKSARSRKSTAFCLLLLQLPGFSFFPSIAYVQPSQSSLSSPQTFSRSRRWDSS